MKEGWLHSWPSLQMGKNNSCDIGYKKYGEDTARSDRENNVGCPGRQVTIPVMPEPHSVTEKGLELPKRGQRGQTGKDKNVKRRMNGRESLVVKASQRKRRAPFIRCRPAARRFPQKTALPLSIACSAGKTHSAAEQLFQKRLGDIPEKT